MVLNQTSEESRSAVFPYVAPNPHPERSTVEDFYCPVVYLSLHPRSLRFLAKELWFTESKASWSSKQQTSALLPLSILLAASSRKLIS